MLDFQTITKLKIIGQSFHTSPFSMSLSWLAGWHIQLLRNLQKQFMYTYIKTFFLKLLLGLWFILISFQFKNVIPDLNNSQL